MKETKLPEGGGSVPQGESMGAQQPGIADDPMPNSPMLIAPTVRNGKPLQDWWSVEIHDDDTVTLIRLNQWGHGVEVYRPTWRWQAVMDLTAVLNGCCPLRNMPPKLDPIGPKGY